MNYIAEQSLQQNNVLFFLQHIYYIRFMRYLKIIVTVALLLSTQVLVSQSGSVIPTGKLFIIGGGDRPPRLMEALIEAADMKPGDYTVVLPMSSASPDTSFYYFKADYELFCKNPIVNLNFTKENINNKPRLDSLKKAKLIFITGGSQSRFMSVVLNTPVHTALYDAYKNGATIAGTSAGAAVMSEHMITGTQLKDTAYKSTFPRVVENNIELEPGLGLITNCIIDQHFIVRSRYNRLFSAIAKFPSLACIGIDEETAIIIHGNKAKVAGMRQVVVMKKPEDLKITAEGLIKFKEMQFGIYTDGDSFEIEPVKK